MHFIIVAKYIFIDPLLSGFTFLKKDFINVENLYEYKMPKGLFKLIK